VHTYRFSVPSCSHCPELSVWPCTAGCNRAIMCIHNNVNTHYLLFASSGIPCSSRAGGVGSIPANAKAQNVPSFHDLKWKLVHFTLSSFIVQLKILDISDDILLHVHASLRWTISKMCPKAYYVALNRSIKLRIWITCALRTWTFPVFWVVF
jgi:hypothetical protein